MRGESICRLGVSIASALVVAGCGAHPAPIAPSRDSAFFGMNGQQLPPLLAAGLGGADPRPRAAIPPLGTAFALAACDWGPHHPPPPGTDAATYRFVQTDHWVASLSRNHLRWQLLGAGAPAPAWAEQRRALAAGCAERSPPRPDAYAGALRALARRYGRHGSFWTAHPRLPYEAVRTYEIWNEPNLSGFWCPQPDPAAYGHLYATARAAVHTVDPAATVLLGGLAPVASSRRGSAPAMAVPAFLTRAVAANPALQNGIDAVGIHPYGPTPNAVLRIVGWFRRALDEARLADVPMNADEFGWTTHGSSVVFPAVPESTRARYVAETARALADADADCRLIGIAPHTWITPQPNPASATDWFALANPLTGEPLPSARAYGQVAKRSESTSTATARAAPRPCGD